MSSFGDFINDGREYRFENLQTPRPMLNYAWNDTFLTAINQFGSGEGAYGGRAACYIDKNGMGRCNILRDGGRYFYIKDGEDLWNPGWFPLQSPGAMHHAVHGLGYSVISGEKNSVSADLRVFVGKTHPAEIWTVSLKNTGTAQKELTFFFACDLSLEGYARYSDYNSYVYARYSQPENLLLFCNEAQERPHKWFNAFMTSSIQLEGFETSRKALLGAYGSFERPEAILKGRLSGSLAACEKMAGCLMHKITLPAGGQIRFSLLLGAADCMETALDIREKLFSVDAVEDEFLHLCQEKENMSKSITVDTPDDKINIFANYWLKQQVQLCAESGRDTGKGFRDQLQDALAIASFNPELAASKILETLQHQYCDGRCVRGWLPVDSHIYSDGPIWISLAVNGYLKETGDFDFLDKEVPYLDEGSASVWEHILLAARYSSDDIGEHGLVLAHDGDWNDSLNGIGTGGKGESVWTSIALCEALRQTAEMARFIKKDDIIAVEMEERLERMKCAINDNAWDGDWYLAAINDLGQSVGSHHEATGRIYLNSQTWAVMTGVADGERREKCLSAIDNMLDSQYGPLTLSPSYRKYDPYIGRLTGFVPGIWENGTPYCHGGAFKAVADCFAGRGEEAYKTLMKILPDSPENPVAHSGCEPYALTNMFMGPENPRAGETMFAWVTGTAGWVFRLVTQYMLGFHPGYSSAKIEPCIPPDWKVCKFVRPWRNSIYQIEIRNPDGRQTGVHYMSVDGTRVEDMCLPLFSDGCEHQIIVEI